MTINVIISSILAATQDAVVKQQSLTDPIVAQQTNWEECAKGILSGIPVSNDIDLAAYLTTYKGYELSDLNASGAAIAVMETGGALLTALASGVRSDLYQFHGGTAPDDEIVKHIVDRMTFDTSTSSQQGAQATMTTPTPTPTPAIAIDPGMANAINALLTQATKGQLKDLNSILQTNANLEADLQQARSDLTNALIKAQTVPLQTTGTTQTATGPLTYEVVMRKANDVFPVANGKRTGHGLSFEIPTLVWKDDQGNVVSHPETPAIDPNYDFDGVKLLLSLTALNRNMNQWLFGHTGTGKSTFVEQVAALMGWPVSRINLDSNLERPDLVGHITLTEQNGTTVSTYEEGILPRAMQRPGFFLIDEIDAGRPEILFVIQRALESKGLMLTEDKGRIVQPHQLFRFVATANTRGQGDEYGMYSGTRAMNASMVDRFTGFIEFDYMKPDRESALLMKMVPGLAKDMADKMAQFAHEVRVAFSKGEVYNTISPRGLSVLAGCYATFTGLGTKDDVALQMAMDLSMLSKATNDTRQKFVELATRCFGHKTK